MTVTVTVNADSAFTYGDLRPGDVIVETRGRLDDPADDQVSMWLIISVYDLHSSPECRSYTFIVTTKAVTGIRECTWRSDIGLPTSGGLVDESPTWVWRAGT